LPCQKTFWADQRRVSPNGPVRLKSGRIAGRVLSFLSTHQIQFSSWNYFTALCLHFRCCFLVGMFEEAANLIVFLLQNGLIEFIFYWRKFQVPNLRNKRRDEDDRLL
jgi:hypothetical protein